MTLESQRLQECWDGKAAWKLWGPAYGFLTKELVQNVANVSDLSTYGAGKSGTGWMDTQIFR